MYKMVGSLLLPYDTTFRHKFQSVSILSTISRGWSRAEDASMEDAPSAPEPPGRKDY